MEPVSVAMIVRNEAERIGDCLRSLQWADEVVVVDSGSIDGTDGICSEAGCRVVRSRWQGYARTKQLAVDSCRNDWVLVVDADEEVSHELAEAIAGVLESPRHSGWRIRRVSWYLGRRIRRCGWGSDYPLRLFRRDRGRFNDRMVHEAVEMAEGSVGTIEAPLLHRPYPDVETHVRKMVRYARLGAAQHRGGGGPFLSAVGRGAWKFLSMYLLRLGFLDGREGFLLCLNSSFGVYLKHLLIWQERHGP